MAKKIDPKCAKCGKGLSVHVQKPGVGHAFVSKTVTTEEKEKYGWKGSKKLKEGVKSGELKKMKTGGFIEPGIENID